MISVRCMKFVCNNLINMTFLDLASVCSGNLRGPDYGLQSTIAICSSPVLQALSLWINLDLNLFLYTQTKGN